MVVIGWAGTGAGTYNALVGPRAQEPGEASEQIEWVQQVRDLGPLVWLIALAAVAAWLLVVGLAAARVRPRRVAPGPDLLDPPGDEPPVLVNLITNRWSLGHDAVAGHAARPGRPLARVAVRPERERDVHR